MANRYRKNGIYLMLSDEELEILEHKYKLSGCKSLRQFIIGCIVHSDIFVLDMDVFRNMSVNIGRTANSINQIAKRINSTATIYKNDIDDLQQLLTEQSENILNIRRKIFNLGNPNTTYTEQI
ncbi:MAG: plasmid mobilization relaxosome protein MobC [Peptoanaerobacter stomatis]|uniref:plasmid mobilization relaxosome protein MobC n=1 Tax=Peptoanaerobacter stomatis TaxID=796937 RepID=UPI003F9F6027